MGERLESYEDFWPFYVSQHLDETNRRLHFVGTTLVVLAVAASALFSPLWLVAAPLAGYGFAWVGHFFFEHNRPATFTYPLYSFAGDWVMYWQVLTGRIPF